MAERVVEAVQSEAEEEDSIVDQAEWERLKIAEAEVEVDVVREGA